jgi:hypothetical protein
MLSEKLDVPLLRSQLKAHQILAACRIYRQGNYSYLFYIFLKLDKILIKALTYTKTQ